MENLENIVTIKATIINYKTDKEICAPIFEAYGEKGLAKFVAWYEENLSMFHHAIIEGFEYNNPNAIARRVVTK